MKPRETEDILKRQKKQDVLHCLVSVLHIISIIFISVIFVMVVIVCYKRYHPMTTYQEPCEEEHFEEFNETEEKCGEL